MKSLGYYSLALMCVAVAALNLIQLRTSFVVSSALASEVSGVSPQARDHDYVARVTSAAQTLLAPASIHLAAGTALKRTGEQLVNSDQRVSTLCQALAQYGAALRVEPANGRSLVLWASLRQLLGNVECREPLTQGDYREALQSALKNAPYDPIVLYSAGVVDVWGGDRRQALALFQRMLTYGTSISAAQQRLMLEQIRDGDDVLALLPPRFPQVANWSRLIHTARLFSADVFHEDARASGVRQSLASVQSQAIQHSAREFEAGQIAENLYLRRLLSLQSYIADDRVRQLIDTELQRIFARHADSRATAEFLAKRGAMRELRIMRTFRAADTRPERSVLAGWGGDDNVQLDNFYATIGFYLPEHQTLRLIQLTARGDRTDAALPNLHLWGSKDNQQWVELETDVHTTRLIIPGQQIVALTIPDEEFRYWKINFASGTRSGSFGAPLGELVRAFGISSLKE